MEIDGKVAIPQGEMRFLGNSVSFWLELQRRFKEGCAMDRTALLCEISELRGKLSFYESRIKEMYLISKQQ